MLLIPPTLMEKAHYNWLAIFLEELCQYFEVAGIETLQTWPGHKRPVGSECWTFSGELF